MDTSAEQTVVRNIELPVGVNPVAQCDLGPPVLATGSSSLPARACKRCGKVYPFLREYFYVYGGGKLGPECKPCYNERARKKAKEWRHAHLEEARERCNKWHRENKRKLRAYYVDWASKNRESIRERRTAWRRKNKKRQYEINAKWLRSDKPAAVRSRVATGYRNSFRSAIRRGRFSNEMERRVGCSFGEFKTYFQSLFRAGMSWDDPRNWEIDHIRPCCEFDLGDYAQVLVCFHYTNLRPVLKEENRRKEYERRALLRKENKETRNGTRN